MMNQYGNTLSDEDICDLLGLDTSTDGIEPETPTSLEEQRKRLRSAQNANRGHPRKGEKREELKQINVSCFLSFSEQFTNISLRTGKTKRTLMEEAINHLIKKYDR